MAAVMQKQGADWEQFSSYLPPGLKARLKAQAARENKYVSVLVAELVAAYLKEREQ